MCPCSIANGLVSVTGVLQSIHSEWAFVASDDCVPAQVALQLMDTSTLGKADREPDFLNMHDQIQKTLKSVVNGLSTQLYNCSPSVLKRYVRAPPRFQQFHRYIS